MTQTWTPVDNIRLVPARDEETCTRFARALTAAAALSTSSRGTLHAMRDCAAGQPQAARTEPGNGGKPRTWCRTHERELAKCDVDDELYGTCIPELIPHRSDPTGEAGISPDHATAHYRDHIKDMTTITAAVERMRARAELYPAQPMKPEPTDDLGDNWCASCVRDAGHLEPVALRPGTSIARKANRCRWCLEFEAAEKFLPPLNLLQAKHRGVRITEGMVEQARKAHRTSSPTRTAARKDKKKRKAQA